MEYQPTLLGCRSQFIFAIYSLADEEKEDCHPEPIACPELAEGKGDNQIPPGPLHKGGGRERAKQVCLGEPFSGGGEPIRLTGEPSLFIAFWQFDIFALHMRNELSLNSGREAIPMGLKAGITEDHFIMLNILPLIPAGSKLKHSVT